MIKWPLLAAAAAVGGVAAATEYFFRFAIERKPDQGTGPISDTGADWTPYLPLIGERKQWLMEQKPEKVSILARDGLRLAGHYLPAPQPGRKVAICVHGYMSCGINDFSGIAPFYQGLGYDLLIVDNRAHGESEGQYFGFGCLDRFDCRNWVRYISERLGADCPIILCGISMGAATVLMTSGLSLPSNVRAVIADCAFTNAWDVFAHVLKRDYFLPPFPLMHLTSALCEARAGYRFDSCSTVDAVKKSSIPSLFIHGEQDSFVPTRMSRLNYAACGAAHKRLLTVPGADHAQSYYVDPALYEKTVQTFLEESVARSEP